MRERIVVVEPAGGHWKVVLSSYGSWGSQAPFLYRDFWSHPKFGTLVSSDTHSFRESDAQWSADFFVVNGSGTPSDSRSLASVFFVEAPRKSSYNLANPSDEPGEHRIGMNMVYYDRMVPLGLTLDN